MHPTTKAILTTIQKWQEHGQGAPTYAELAHSVGLAHPSSVQRHLKHLENLGYITRTRSARSIALTWAGVKAR